MFLSFGLGISSAFATGFECVPLSVFWDSSRTGHCINIDAFYYAIAGLHLFTEVLLYVLPIYPTWSMNLPSRQKIGSIGLFIIGLMLVPALTCVDDKANDHNNRLIIISCARIVMLRDVFTSKDITCKFT
jgi:hypothetical protein